MDDLRTTLLTLSPDDRAAFDVFLQGQRQRAAGRLDVRLCQLLLLPRALPTPALLARLYPAAPNPVAYHALRKRLLSQLTDFLVLRQRRRDATATASVRGQLTLAQYLFEAGVPRLAWNTLRKAERLALHNEQFELLNTVYNLQIEQAHSPHAEPLAEVLARRLRNKKAADEAERATIADSLLRQRLRQARTASAAAAPPAVAAAAPAAAVTSAATAAAAAAVSATTTAAAASGGRAAPAALAAEAPGDPAVPNALAAAASESAASDLAASDLAASDAAASDLVVTDLAVSNLTTSDLAAAPALALTPSAPVAFEQTVQDVLREYDLQEAFARSPALLARLMGIARSAMLVRGDFARFAAYLERCYTLMERRHGFGPAHRGHQLRLLCMLAHAHYRSRHFAEAAARAAEGRALLATGRQREHAEFTPRFALLLAAAEAFRGNNALSIKLLTETLARTPALALPDELTARLQLAFHYFAAADFGQANKILTRLGQTDHWLEQHLGLSWLLAKMLSEMLVLAEMDHDDLALARLRAIERLLLERYPDPAAPGGPFRYILAYLALVRPVLRHDDLAPAQRLALRRTTEQLTALVPHRRDDLQARSFYAWLLARLSGRPFYPVLLEITDRPATKKTLR